MDYADKKEQYDRELIEMMGEPSATILTALQLKYVGMDKHYEAEIKPFLEDYRQAKADLIAELGVGVFFADHSGTVYKTDESNGRFVYNEPFQIKRTRREGEAKGTLSLKEAREAGFVEDK